MIIIIGIFIFIIRISIIPIILHTFSVISIIILIT
jgi:hypothetical protein